MAAERAREQEQQKLLQQKLLQQCGCVACGTRAMVQVAGTRAFTADVCGARLGRGRRGDSLEASILILNLNPKPCTLHPAPCTLHPKQN